MTEHNVPSRKVTYIHTYIHDTTPSPLSHTYPPSYTTPPLPDVPPSLVEYVPLVERMVRILEILLDRQGGITIGGGGGQGRRSRGKGGRGRNQGSDGKGRANNDPPDDSDLPWLLREFELVDLLINQLELMMPGDRRRCLMALQYALAAADLKQEGGYRVRVVAGTETTLTSRCIDITICIYQPALECIILTHPLYHTSSTSPLHLTP